MSLRSRYEAVLEQVACACEAAGRSLSDVTVIGVSKTVGLGSVQQAIDAGIRDFGENRPDELVRKHDAFPMETWHFIGNIQSRQLRNVVGRASLIHSLCSADHARKIDDLAAKAGIVQPVLIEINDGEENKQGVSVEDAPALFETVRALDHLRVEGLMGMAPKGDAHAARRAFERIRVLRDDLESRYSDELAPCRLQTLSMGMSDDFASAIAEGSTMVRVGRAIFSEDYR